MNSVATTGGLTLAGTQLDGVVIWLCQLAHLPEPDHATAATVGVGLLMGLHALYNFINDRWPAPVAAPAPVVTPPVAQGATP